MILTETDTSRVGVTIRIRKKIKAQQLPKFKLLKPKVPKTEKETRNCKSKRLLNDYDFEELKTLIGLLNENSNSYRIAQVAKELTREKTELVLVEKKGEHHKLIKYIVRVAGMRYVINIDKLTISIYDPISFIESSGDTRKRTLIGGIAD